MQPKSENPRTSGGRGVVEPMEIPGNPFALVNIVIQRSKQLEYGAPARVPATHEENVVTTAMREAKRGLLAAKMSEETPD